MHFNRQKSGGHFHQHIKLCKVFPGILAKPALHTDCRIKTPKMHTIEVYSMIDNPGLQLGGGNPMLRVLN